MAAIDANSDATKGIWKSPSGTGYPLQASEGMPTLTSNDSSSLSAAGINPIRLNNGSTIPFGGRTLARSSDSSLYVPLDALRIGWPLTLSARYGYVASIGVRLFSAKRGDSRRRQSHPESHDLAAKFRRTVVPFLFDRTGFQLCAAFGFRSYPRLMVDPELDRRR